LVRLDGSPYELAPGRVGEPAGDGGPGRDGAGDGGPADVAPGSAAPDASLAAPASETVTLPAGVTQVVSTGASLGWLREGPEGTFLEHLDERGATIVSTLAAAPEHGGARLTWAGDRYLVRDEGGSNIARFVVVTPRGRSKQGTRVLQLGGRLTLPGAERLAGAAAWDTAGARHIGLARRPGPREIQFANIALGGLVFDPPALLRRERDVLDVEVLWDGAAYVVLWSERVDATTANLYLVRFRCPDEA
jgi:hypothetical protein